MPRPGYQKKCGASHPLSRRTILKSMLGVGLGLQFVGSAVSAAFWDAESRSRAGLATVGALSTTEHPLDSQRDVSTLRHASAPVSARAGRDAMPTGYSRLGSGC